MLKLLLFERAAKEFQIFDLHVIKGWPVRDVAHSLRINAAQVYVAKFRVLRRLKKEVRRLHRELL